MSKVQIGSKSSKTNSWKRNTSELQQTKVSLSPEIPRQSAESWEDRAEKYRISLCIKGLPDSHRFYLIRCHILLSKTNHLANRPSVWSSMLFLFSYLLCNLLKHSKSPVHTFDLDVQIYSHRYIPLAQWSC